MADFDFTATLAPNPVGEATQKKARGKKAQAPVNLASLPRDEALQRARIAGCEILGDANAIKSGFDRLCMEWINVNMPRAVGQSDEEFSELLDAMENEFFTGMSASVEQFRSIKPAEDTPALDRLGALLNSEACSAWKIHNTLAFMIEALPGDTEGGLPVQCMLISLKADMGKLASSLMRIDDLMIGVGHV